MSDWLGIAIAASSATSIASTSEVKALLNISNSDYDTVIDALLAPITDFFESKCDCKLIETIFTAEVFDGDGSQRLWIGNKGRVKTVSAITIDGESVDIDYLDVYPFYIQFDSRETSSAFTYGNKNIAVSFTSGFSASDMPNDLKMAFAQMISFEINQMRASGLDSKNVRGRSVTYTNELPMMVKYAINKYKYNHIGVI